MGASLEGLLYDGYDSWWTWNRGVTLPCFYEYSCRSWGYDLRSYGLNVDEDVKCDIQIWIYLLCCHLNSLAMLNVNLQKINF